MDKNMPKSIGKCFDEKLTFTNLLLAHNRAKKNKTNRYELLKFEVDLESNLIKIMNALKNKNYKLGKYRVFTIYEPKERVIKCLPYADRIVQQWYIHEFIKPYIIPRFINTTCACIDGKGTLYSANMVQKYMRIMKRKYNNYYVLKLDIKKYFYNIDKDILYDTMKKFIKDKKLLWLTELFIYDNDSLKGIPIGNYTSQYFANIYLSILDKYVKEELQIKYYVRYMDDMVILLKDKNECVNILKKVKTFLEHELKLELNAKSRYYPSKLGVNFCGYVIYETHRLLRKRSKLEINKKIKTWDKMNKNGILNRKKMEASLNSWLSHAKHANSYLFRKQVLVKINKIIK